MRKRRRATRERTTSERNTAGYSGSVRLQPGETPVLEEHPWIMVEWPRYVATLGLYSIWRRRRTFLLTDRRIIITRGVLSHTEKSLRTDHVEEAVVNRQRFHLSTYVDLVTGAGVLSVERLGPLSPRRARRFASAVLQGS